MKSLIILTSLFSFINASRLLLEKDGSGNGGGPPGKDKDETLCACPANVDPWCCNGEDYSNKCSAMCEGKVKYPVEAYCQQGKCEEQPICACNLLFDPQCCMSPEGVYKDYGNTCMAQCYVGDDLSSCISGECADVIGECTMDYLPVCCDDGNTYPNQCAASYFGYDDCNDGRCDEQVCACTADYAPVCCNGNDYSNVCTAECRGELADECVEGTCICDRCQCTMDWDPLCCEGRTYGNACEAECMGIYTNELIEDCKEGTCESQVCACTTLWDPMCCDGISFGNGCEASCHGVGNPEDQCIRGLCTDKPNFCACTLLWDPYCCDDETFGNLCDVLCNELVPGGCTQGECASYSSGKSDDERDCLTKCDEEFGEYGYSAHCCQTDVGNADYATLCKAECDLGVDIADAICQAGKCKDLYGDAADEDPENVDDYDTPCEGKIEPVCCTKGNGVQERFDNLCLATAADPEYTDKKCNLDPDDNCGVECVCTYDINPVFCCRNDGAVQSFDNQCLATCFCGSYTEDSCSSSSDDVCERNDDKIDDTKSVEDKGQGDKGDKPVAAKNVPDDNVDYSECVCTDDENPVCCWGKEYSNSCMAECAGIKRVADQCQQHACSTCECTDDYNPTCCQGVEFDNACEAECVLGIDDAATDGSCSLTACENPCRANKMFLPYCCKNIFEDTGFKTYSNPSLAKCAGYQSPLADNDYCTFGKCDAGCVCADIYEPVCCAGVTHPSWCDAKCIGYDDNDQRCSDGECPDPCMISTLLDPWCCEGTRYSNQEDAACSGYQTPLEINSYCKNEECNPCGACPLDEDPVCCEGVTYANECNAQCAGFSEPAKDDARCTAGECDKFCAVDNSYNPFCCSGRDYPNPSYPVCLGYKEPILENEYCENKKCNGEECICITDEDPYCCGGINYSNPCQASCEGIDVLTETERCTSGSCPLEDCDVNADGYRVVDVQCCGGSTYMNPAEAECLGGYSAPIKDNSLCRQGSCLLCGCQFDDNPVCCMRDPAEGMVWTFPNLCTAKCSDRRISDDMCVDDPDGTECFPPDAAEELEENVDEYPDNDKVGREGDCSDYADQCDDIPKNIKGTCVCKDKITKEIIECGDATPVVGITVANNFDENIDQTLCDDQCSGFVGGSPLCCWGVEFENICYAECAGIMKPDEKCDLFGCPTEDCVCTDEYIPICCKDITFGNPCEAECNGVQVPAEDQIEICKMGECDKCIITADINEICCGDITFVNPSAAICEGFDPDDVDQCKMGKCSCMITLNIAPVCCDGNDFDNPSIAKCDGYDFVDDCSLGKCDKCKITKDIKPVCCDGKRYVNPSAAVCAGYDIDDDCTDGECKDECVCTLEWNPFCCDGKTMGNPCQARCDGYTFPRLECKRGECDEKCACPYINSPICCNGVDYGNLCEARCHGVDKPEENCQANRCDGECYCTKEYKPFCCTDDDGKETSYSNSCMARCDGFVTSKHGNCVPGECASKAPCYCPDIYAPVCCDGTEYDNACAAECFGETIGDEDVSTCVEGECSPSGICTLQWEPTCCGGDTYGNLCLAIQDGWSSKQCKKGACEDFEICTHEYFPLCCNGCDYSNPCLAEFAGIDEPAEKSPDCVVGECSQQPHPCDLVYDPLCCSGITYGNECMAKNAGYLDPSSDCIDGHCDHSFCTLEWNPLCCDGQSYGNPCLAERDGVSHPAEDNCLTGLCEDQLCICPAVWNPICCTDDDGDKLDFGSPCLADCNGFFFGDDGDLNEQCDYGTCKSQCVCTLEYDAYCCGDDKDKNYDNKCLAECDGYDVDKDCFEDTCEKNNDQCLCTLDFKPICCNGKQFSNPCHAECNGIQAPAEEQYDQCFNGLCSEHSVCPQIYNPLCCDGKDYSNGCIAKADGISDPDLCYHGKCSDVPSCPCQLDYKPLCCDGDKDYPNTCSADCDGYDTSITSEECVAGRCDNEPDCLCPLVIEPVCCTLNADEYTTDYTFDNLCIAKCKGLDEDYCISGECKDVGKCTLEWNPYCCDGVEYGNKCKAKLDGIDVDDDDNNCVLGLCDMCACTRDFKPVCCDRNDYDNLCAAKCNDYDPEDCRIGQCKDNVCMCTLEHDPLCCSDPDTGKKTTHYNPCLAECAGIEEPAEEQTDICTMGECKDICTCTLEYNPICCNGKDYSNPCSAECTGNITPPAQSNDNCAMGACEDQDGCICPQINNPVCCPSLDDDGSMVFNTYTSPCVATCHGITNPNLCASGRCEDIENCKCTREYDPYCCDDEDYGNPCMVECEYTDKQIIDLILDGTCSKNTCNENICACTKDLNPYCCTDDDGKDIEYDNPCLAQCDGIFAPQFTCSRGTCANKPEECTLEFDPVCCSGEDFANPCFAERCGKDVDNDCSEGECKDICSCPKNVNPICCNSQTFLNPCLAECSGIDSPAEEQTDICKMGYCQQCKCDKKFDPVCCNGYQFGNKCLAECDIDDFDKECTTGPCDDICVCPDYIAPICCNNIDYDNECLAECDGIDIENDNCVTGECNKEPCDCTNDIDPYCCWGVPYDNICLAECDGINKPDQKCDKGECGSSSSSEDECPCPYTVSYLPICCDGIEYSSECDAKCSLGDNYDKDKCVDGTCPGGSDCICTTDYSPVCCDDNRDFSNICNADCDADIIDTDKQCVKGTCSMTSCSCDYVYAPVCCDGKTYGNDCDAECNGFTACHDNDKCSDGECKQESSSSSSESSESSTAYGGIFSLNTKSGHNQMNVLIVIIQLCILAVCCLSLGLSISFCFKNPNKITKSYAPDK